jgi:hypothetical protein
MTNMKAELLARDKINLEDDLWLEAVLWSVPVPVRGSRHSYKYRLALIDSDVCVLRYDNEAGKGDHKHMGETEVPYTFSTIDDLWASFFTDIQRYRKGGRRWQL